MSRRASPNAKFLAGKPFHRAVGRGQNFLHATAALAAVPDRKTFTANFTTKMGLKRHDIAVRIQALALAEVVIPLKGVAEITMRTNRAISYLKQKACQHGYNLRIPGLSRWSMWKMNHALEDLK